MKNIKRLVTLLVIMFTLSSVFAYQLTPLNVTYDPTGAGAAKVYTVTNDSDSPVAIKMSAVKRSIDTSGEEYNEDATSYFSIQPAKMIIKPQSTQLVRVQYRGPKTVSRELSFRIVSEQIPYSKGAQAQTEGQMISFLFVYSTSAYVKPSKIVERVQTTAEVTSDGKVQITLTNSGSVHQILNDLSITLTASNGASYTLSSEELGNASGLNLLSDSIYIFQIEMPAALNGAKNLSAAASYDYSWQA